MPAADVAIRCYEKTSLRARENIEPLFPTRSFFCAYANGCCLQIFAWTFVEDGFAELEVLAQVLAADVGVCGQLLRGAAL